MIVPGGGISLDGERWVACRPGFFLPVRVLSRLFRRLFLERLLAAHQAGRLKFFGDHAALADAQAFAAYLAPLRRAEWVVYAKRPFGGPQAVLAYLSRYTHRVAIANSRLIACDRSGVTFRWKDYRAEGRDRQKVMTLATAEFIRRFLIHVLPYGFHRIRHYGLLASGTRADNIARARELLAVSKSEGRAQRCRRRCRQAESCPCCGGRMIIIEVFERGATPRYRPTASNDRHQARHLMTASQSCKSCSASLAASRPATAELRPDIRLSSQIVRQPTEFDATRGSSSSRSTIHRLAGAPRTPFTHLIRGTQIPIAPAAPPTSPSRGFLVWGFLCQGVRRSGKSFFLRQFLCSISKPVSSSRPAAR